MSWTRSWSFPRLRSNSNPQGKEFYAIMSPHQPSAAHSRDSSGAFSFSSPNTPTLSSCGHSRYPSSSSSLATTPDSPSTAPTSKTTLHDLLEEPAERDEADLQIPDLSAVEPLCICDTPLCEHRQNSISQSAAAMFTPPEWIPGDDYFSDGELPGRPFTKRRRSVEIATNTFASRLSRHLPSIRKRMSGHHGGTASISETTWRNGPPSRASSLRLPVTRSVTLPVMPEARMDMAPTSPAEMSFKERSVSPSRSRAPSQTPSQYVEIEMPVLPEEPINREELASTPLLPPIMTEYFDEASEAVASPLQSPTVADSATVSMVNSPVGTPPLSARPSMTSLHNARAGHATNPLNEMPNLAIAEEKDDPWAIKLGHANFHIFPEPYLPEVCDAQTCKRLQDDWETALVEFMQQAGRIREHYGVTSETYKLTLEKWEEVNEQWRQFHKQANTEAQASGKSPVFQPLPETPPVLMMPSLNDPQQPSKFPAVDEKDIVGPMVRYVKIQHERRPSRTPSFLKIFTDPSSLLSGRSSLNR